MNKSLTVQKFKDDPADIIFKKLTEDGNTIQEYCIAGFEQTKSFLETAEFSEKKFSFIGIYSGRSLKNPKIFGIISRSCYAYILKEAKNVPLHNK